MIILGLGSNVGDRMANLRQALQHLKALPQFAIQEISPLYVSDALLPPNASDEWNKPYLNCAIRAETTLSPYALHALTKSIEKKIGKPQDTHWGPRCIDIDFLAWDDKVIFDKQLHIPHEHLSERPFALWPLADVAPFWVFPDGKRAIELAQQWGSRFAGKAPLHCRQIQQRLDTPELMGILNVTADSFSDGGQFENEEAALRHAFQLVEDGAEIIDIGAEATGPKAIALNHTAEWARLEPFLKSVLHHRHPMLVPPKISVDTRHAATAKKAIALGVDWINDVSGLNDSAMREVLAASTVDIVFMHHLGIPVSKSALIPLKNDTVATVYDWAEKQIAILNQAGIASSRLIFDVGIGYGKTAEQSLLLLQNITTFKKLGVRLLVGHSRKSFLTQFTDKPAYERDIETTIFSLYLPVDYLRIHNVDLTARAFKVKSKLSEQ